MSLRSMQKKWIEKELPQLAARGPEEVSRIIEQAIRETRAKRSLLIFLVIFIPAAIVNYFHVELVDLLGGSTSRFTLIAFSVVMTTVASSHWSQKILQERIETLAKSGPGLPQG